MLNKGSAEVVVIGGGIIGCSTAYYLAKEGVDTILIEKNDLASGTSRACQGGIVIPFTAKASLRNLALASIRLYRGLIDELNSHISHTQIEYESQGLLVIAENEDQWSLITENYDECRREGLAVRLLRRERLRKLERFLAEDLVGGIEFPQCLQINPIHLTLGLAKAAKKLGATVYMSTEVKGIEVRKNRVQSVVTSGPKIKARFVVNAAGVQSPYIGSLVSLPIPIRPCQGQILVTEPIAPIVSRMVIESSLTRGAFNSKTFFRSQETRIKFFCTQTKDGNCLIGKSESFVGFNLKTIPDIIAALARRAIRFIPRLRQINIIRTYAGLRPYSVDQLPILGKVEGIKGFLIATGHGSEGFTLGPISGKLISELVTKDHTTLPIDEYRYSRFKNQK